MIRSMLVWTLTLGLASCAASLGCREEGPAQRIGKAFDEAAADIRDAVEQEVDDALDAAADAADEAAERLREEAEAAREKAHEKIDEVAAPARS